MKRFRFWIIGLLTIAALFLTKPIQAQSRFTDVQNHWAQSCIEGLAQRNVIRGVNSTQFRPDDPVTRAQFASMVVTAFPNLMTPVRTNRSFRDVPANFWAKNAISTAHRSNFFSGYEDNTFRPNANVTRAQALTVLASGLKFTPNGSVDSTLGLFADARDIPAYAARSIAAATEQNAVVNFPDVRQLKPNQAASRAEVAAFLCQALPQTKGLITSRYIPTPAVGREIRGVWLTNIDSDVLFGRDRLRDAVSELARLNFNTLYPTVWNWGYTLYPSGVMKREVGLAIDPRPVAAGLQNRDMLKEMIDQAHQRKMAVIPWFEFGFMAPKDSELAQKHRDWWTQKQDGSTDDTPKALDGVQVPIWFNPFKPEVQQFILSLVTEVVDQYDVDGIQFDDHFGLPIEFGYDSDTIKLYQQEHNGKSPPLYDPDRCEKANMKDLCPEFLAKDPQWAEWLRWRSDKIEQFLKQMFQTVKARKNNVIIGLAPLDLPYAYERALVDWHKWEQDGFIEELIPQIYFQGQKFVDRIDLTTKPELLQARNHIPTAIGILSGLSSAPRSLDEMQRQVQAVRDRGYAGMSFFFYETVWNKGPEAVDQRKAGWQRLFPAQVDRVAVAR